MIVHTTYSHIKLNTPVRDNIPRPFKCILKRLLKKRLHKEGRPCHLAELAADRKKNGNINKNNAGLPRRRRSVGRQTTLG
jgi:hypothetical protein